MKRGYSEGKSEHDGLPNVQEFLFRMEQQSIYNINWIQPKHIQSHYTYLSKRPNNRYDGGLSTSMLHHHMHAIRIFFGWLQKLEAIPLNPHLRVGVPTTGEKNPRQALTINEIKHLYEKGRKPQGRKRSSASTMDVGLRREQKVKISAEVT